MVQTTSGKGLAKRATHIEEEGSTYLHTKIDAIFKAAACAR